MAAPKKPDFETRMQQLTEELALQRELTEHYRAEIEAQEADGTRPVNSAEPTLLYDPFNSKNPFKIIGEIEPDKDYPEGAIVAWKSPVYRERRQWRGWKPFTYGDEYAGKKGEFLNKYIPDPPPMLAASASLDNYVRRGDVVLSRLDKRIWMTRQEQRLLKSRERQGLHGGDQVTVLGDGIEITGEGTKQSRRPRGGFRPEPESQTS